MSRDEMVRESEEALAGAPPSAGTEMDTARLSENIGPALPPGDVSPPALPCANCGVMLTGPFCAQCGQHVADYHRSVWRFVTDFLDNTFCWDNKIFRTFELLIRRPGYLTCQFMNGRRVSYVHPLRLFLFTSAVCLALLHFGGASHEKSVAGRQRDAEKTARHALTKKNDTESKVFTDGGAAEENTRHDAPAAVAMPSSLPPDAAAVLAKLLPQPSPTPALPVADSFSPAPSSPPGATPPSADEEAALKAKLKNAIKTEVGDKRADQISDLGDMIGRTMEKKLNGDRLERFNQEMVEGFRQRLSWVALAMLPIFALMLRVLYWRKDSFYFLHLVFSLHYHTFLLVFWTVYSWLGTLLLHPKFLHALAGWLLLGVPVYLFLSLRRVYGGGVRATWVKVVLLGGMHFLAIFIAFAIIGGLAFMSAG